MTFIVKCCFINKISFLKSDFKEFFEAKASWELQFVWFVVLFTNNTCTCLIPVCLPLPVSLSSVCLMLEDREMNAGSGFSALMVKQAQLNEP